MIISKNIKKWLVPINDRALKVLHNPRKPELDQRLVWRGRDRKNGASCDAAALFRNLLFPRMAAV